MKIVLISPNAANLRAMSATFTALSHQVIALEGGKARMRLAAEQESPDVMLIEGMCRDVGELESVEYVTRHYPDTAVVLLCSSHTPEFLIQSMRAGVREVLPSPADASTLEALATRLESKVKGSQARANGRILSFIGCKGGSGTTFLATNVGHHLSQRSNVLLIDLNLQFGDALSVLHDGSPPSTIADVARGIDRLDASLLTASTVKITPSYSILAAPDDASQVMEIKPEHIDAILNLAVSHYDFVLIDLARSIDPVSIRALDRAWRIFPVAQLTLPALRNLRQLMAAFSSLGYPTDKTEVIVNRYEKSAAIGLDDLRRTLHSVKLRTVPNSYKDVNKSIDQGMALANLAKSNSVVKALVDMAESLKPAQPQRGLIDRWLKRA